MNNLPMACMLGLLIAGSLIAQDVKPDLKSITLPKPDTTGGKPLMQALHDRQSSRSFSSDTMPLPLLSNLLWAACGINRPESQKRTAPSAMNWQEVDVYLATAKGCYLYDPASHSLKLVLAEDLRAKTGMQPFVGEAPLNLVYVADLTKMKEAAEEDKRFYSGVDAAFISQNVYLFCASAGLATVVRGSLDREALAKAMNLRPEQRVVLAQTVGYAKHE